MTSDNRVTLQIMRHWATLAQNCPLHLRNTYLSVAVVAARDLGCVESCTGKLFFRGRACNSNAPAADVARFLISCAEGL